MSINKQLINFIQNGESFDAEVLNRPTDELADLINTALIEVADQLEGSTTPEAPTGGGVLGVNGITLFIDSATYQLPDTTVANFPLYARVRCLKLLAVEPTIEAFGTEEVITGSGQVGSGISYDINSEIVFIWNGTRWEV